MAQGDYLIVKRRARILLFAIRTNETVLPHNHSLRAYSGFDMNYSMFFLLFRPRMPNCDIILLAISSN